MAVARLPEPYFGLGHYKIKNLFIQTV